MYFPSLGQMVIATSHWLSCNLPLVADTQSLRQFSRQFVTMATAFQPPPIPSFHLKLAKAVISAPLHGNFQKWCADF